MTTTATAAPTPPDVRVPEALFAPPPWWVMIGRLLPARCCAQIVAEANRAGWTHGTYGDGRRRENVSVRFFREGESDLVDPVIARLRRAATDLGALLGVDVTPHLLDTVQISRWRPGDHYDVHRDHEPADPFDRDRKLTIWVSLTPGGRLGLSGVGEMRAAAGDALAFSAITPHWAPKQDEGERISLAAWVPGPRWR